jgi:hypothetical protein
VNKKGEHTEPKQLEFWGLLGDAERKVRPQTEENARRRALLIREQERLREKAARWEHALKSGGGSSQLTQLRDLWTAARKDLGRIRRKLARLG